MILSGCQMPGGKGDIDLLAISPSGIYIIDVKAHAGRVERRDTLRGARLYVDDRDKTLFVSGMRGQTDAVTNALDGVDTHAQPVTPLLCFPHGRFVRLGVPKVDGVPVLTPAQVLTRLRLAGQASPAAVDRAARRLAERLPPFTGS